MKHPLQQRVEAVRRRAVSLVRQHALRLFAAAVIAILLSFGLFDFLLRLQDAGARWILSLLALGLVGWAAWSLIRPAWAHGASLVQVAQRIEGAFPQLGHRLSSAMDFLAQDQRDKTAGSTELRRAVVAEAEALSAGLDFYEAIDARRTRTSWFYVGFAAALCMGGIAAASTSSAQLALERLLMPWSDAAWPRRNALALVKRPDKLAVGDDFELEVVDRAGRLPDNVQVLLRYATPTGTRTETKEMKPLGERMVFRLDNVSQGFAYRARGGDDDTMPWTELAVIEPPKVQALEISVTPPAYTGLPRLSAGRVVKAIIGSSLTIEGRVDKPVVSAKLRSDTQGVPLPSVVIAHGGLRFAAPAGQETHWLVERSAAYWVELSDASGLPTGRDTRVEVQAVADSPPVISWERPGDHTFVTPRAVVQVKCLVKDDLAIQHVHLRYLRPGTTGDGEQVVDLYSAPVPGDIPNLDNGDSRSIAFGWDLSRLAGLVPGDVLAVRVTAEDYQPQLATSIVRRLTIITEDELESRISQRQTAILGQLAEALRIERECREQISALQIRLAEKGSLDESDLNHLQSAQLNQRQVEKLLGSGSDGVEGQLAALLDELAANRIEGKAIAERMNELLQKVQQLNREPLVEIVRQLTEAFKTVREGIDGRGPNDAAPALAAAAARQDEAILALEDMLGALSQWDSFSRLAREIGQIRSQQERLAEATQSLQFAAAAVDSLSADQRATAKQLRQSELELARQLDKIQSRMHQMLVRLQESDPVAAATLADALDAGRRLAIGGQMRDAAEKLGQFQFGQSQRTQTAALEGLKQLLDLLSSRREDELARTIKSLQAASSELAGLAARQRAVQQELDAAAAEPSTDEHKRRVQRLAKELERLAQDIEPLGRRLELLRAAQAASSVGQAGEHSRAAGKSAGEGAAGDAQAQSRQAQQRLEDAQRQVQQAIAQAERELAQQQLARLEQWLSGLVARQKNVVTEIVRLEEVRAADQGQLGVAQQATLRNLAAEQRLVADETEQLRLKMADQAAFAMALAGARQEMSRATAALERGQTGVAAQQPAQSAATRLAQMLAALKPDESPAPATPPPDEPPTPAPPGGQSDPFSSLAALKLLELLQGEINRRTQEIETIRGQSGSLTDEQAAELEALADEQGRLAELVFNLIRESVPRPEDDLDSLLK